MLEGDYQQSLNRLLEHIPCQVVLPPDWEDVLARERRDEFQHRAERRFMRRSFEMHVILEVWQSLPTISREHQFGCVLARDLSRSGISFLHTQQFFPNERVLLWLPIGKTEARVARCVKRGPRCYETGCRIA